MDGNLLRQHYDDLKRRIDAQNVDQKSAYLNYLKSTFGPVKEGYELASSVDRERILKELRDVSLQLWSAGNRPQALALGVILLNFESQSTADEDAVFVKAATDNLING